LANKRPLVNSSGTIGELATADLILPASLGTGTPSAGTFLRGDGTWAATSGSQNVFIQQTDPSGSVGYPYIWFQTDVSGTVLDILKGAS
jgi:hypothetical protein